MICLFNGCSHTEGSQIPPSQTWANLVLKSISPLSKFYHIHSVDGNADEHIFKHLNGIDEFIDFKNPTGLSVAKSGKGNDAICFETINYVEYLKQIHKKPDYVFIQWSGPSRSIVQDLVTNYVQFINPHNVEEFKYNTLKPEPLASSLTLTYYIILQNYLENNKIKYIFVDYMGTDDIVYNPYIKKSINYDNIVGNTLIDLFKITDLTIDKEGHPNDMGFRYIASLILEKLNLSVISTPKWISHHQKINYTEDKLNDFFIITYPSKAKLL